MAYAFISRGIGAVARGSGLSLCFCGSIYIRMSTFTDKQSGYQTSPSICAQALKDEYVGHVSIFWGGSGDDMRAPLIH